MTGPMDPRIAGSFTGWLYRPYFDLGPPAPDPPFHVAGLRYGFRALAEGRRYPRIQVAMNQSFRDGLVASVGVPEYLVESPADLPEQLWSPEWRVLCEAVEAFDDLVVEQQVRLAWLIGKLCLYRFLTAFLPEGVADRIRTSHEHASLAYLRALGRYRLMLDGETQDYSMVEFERIAAEAPPGIARVDSHYQMVAQNVKHHNDLAGAERWQADHLTAIESSRTVLDDFTYQLVMSRYHRVAGFLPQMRRDKAGVEHEMSLAEKYARELPRDDDVHELAAKEMLYPVLESRTKEAMWMGDLELALQRAVELTELSPHDPRAWLHLGELHVERDEIEDAVRAYRKTVRYAPPGAEVALFMIGQCLEALEDPAAACDAYVGALRIDPLGVSSAERLSEVARATGSHALLAWATALLEELGVDPSEAAELGAEPYKHMPPPEEGSPTTPATRQ